MRLEDLASEDLEDDVSEEPSSAFPAPIARSPPLNPVLDRSSSSSSTGRVPQSRGSARRSGGSRPTKGMPTAAPNSEPDDVLSSSLPAYPSSSSSPTKGRVAKSGSPSPPSVARRFEDLPAHFSYLRKIGIGTYSEVFLGYDSLKKRDVVLKRMKTMHAGNFGIPPFAVREAESLQRLLHPNVIRYWEGFSLMWS